LSEQARLHRDDGQLRSIWLTVPGGFLALERVDAIPDVTPFRHSRPGWHLVALRIERSARESVEAELLRHGVRIEHQTRWTLYVRDPEGNRVGLSHHPAD